MKHFSKILLGFIFLMLLGAGETQETAAVVWNDEALVASFHDVYTDAGIEVALIQVQIFDTTGNRVQDFDEREPFTIQDGEFKFLIHNRLAKVADGTYRIIFRVFSTGGAVSEWSEAYWVTKEWIAISKPGGCALSRR